MSVTSLTELRRVFGPEQTLVDDLAARGYFDPAKALWGSLTMGRVLGFAAVNPGREFAMSEIYWRTNASFDSVRRAIHRLVDAELLERRPARGKGGRGAVYVLPDNHVFLQAFRELSLRYAVLGPRLCAARDELGSAAVVDAFVYGSFARYDDRPTSDIDVGVVGRANLYDLARFQPRLYEETDRLVTIHLFTVDEWADARHRDDFIGRVYASPRIPLI